MFTADASSCVIVVPFHLLVEFDRWFSLRKRKKRSTWRDGLKVHIKDLKDYAHSWDDTRNWVVEWVEINGKFKHVSSLSGPPSASSSGSGQ